MTGEPMICGIKGFMGCGAAIDTVAEMYRCVDCGYAFHKPCILSHFNGKHQPHPLRETQLLVALDSKEKDITRLQDELRAALAQPTH